MDQQKTSYPLCWPLHWKRAKSRKRAAFHRIAHGQTVQGNQTFRTKEKKTLSVADATGRLLGALSRMGVPDYNVIVSTNIQVRLDGLPYSNQREPSDPGVAVYWKQKGAEKCMAIDIYDRVADNLAAVALTLDYMRGIERHGGAEILERVFLGFQALPPPMTGGRPWRDVLGVDVGCSLNAAEVSYRIRAKELHPDNQGGDQNKMAELNEAIRQAREALR